jgi:hypothetical protein
MITEPSEVTVVKRALPVWCAPVPAAVVSEPVTVAVPDPPVKVVRPVFVSTLPSDSVAMVVKVETWPEASVSLLPLPPSLRPLAVVVAIPVVMVLPSEVIVLKIVDT